MNAGCPTNSDEAVRCFERGVEHYLKYHLDHHVKAQFRLLGGSNARRDLFFLMLIGHQIAARTVPPALRAGYAAAAGWLHS